VRTTGTYVISTTRGEPFRAFVPHALPPMGPPLAPSSYEQANLQAELALARLSSVSGLVPSVDWLLYSAVRKEALLTSQIEGTQASIADLLDDEAGFAVSNGDDVEEVSNYLRAFRAMQAQMRSPTGLPMSVRLWCDAHRLLLDGTRGATKQPGLLRRSQNWIGGTRPGNAMFVPPPADQVPALLADLERFIHGPNHEHGPPALPNALSLPPQLSPQLSAPLPAELPPLVKTALVHVQFETIHPFLDGNGRIGRMLIAALLEHWGLLPEPLLYLSGYLKQHQAEYYRRLSCVRTEGDWEGWVAFFLEAVSEAAAEAERGIIAIASLVATDRRRLLASPKVNAAGYRLFELLPMMPRFTIDQVRQKLDTSFPTATGAVTALERLGILVEQTGQKKNRSYGYAAYIALLAG
jgi:Fic family protein